MISNDDTVLMGADNQVENTQVMQETPVQGEPASEKKTNWKKVALGGASGILLGAGTLYAVNAMAGNNEEPASETAASQTTSSASNVATVEGDMSFEEAFQSARAQVGPGGVFEWHGGVYGTYTVDEWNAMSDAEKAEFTNNAMSGVQPHSAQPVHADVQHTTVEVHREVIHEKEVEVQPTRNTTGDKHQVDDNIRPVRHDEPFIADTDDVHVVGRDTVEGHEAVAVDLDNDGQADVAIIDVNDNHTFDDNDLLLFPNGEMMTRGELAQQLNEEENANGGAQEPDNSQGYVQTAYENNPDDADVVYVSDENDGQMESDEAGADPYLQQASYTEDANMAEDEGMMDPNLQQASYTDDMGSGVDDSSMGVDYMDDMGMDLQSI